MFVQLCSCQSEDSLVELLQSLADMEISFQELKVIMRFLYLFLQTETKFLHQRSLDLWYYLFPFLMLEEVPISNPPPQLIKRKQTSIKFVIF